MPNTSSEVTPDRAAVAQELERIAASVSFRKAERCVRLLRYLIERSIEGRESELKEYTLGVTVFERPDSFDPRTDPVVRLEARRLRLKLAEYYQQEGLEDPVVVELPKGAYVPRFRARVEPRAQSPEIAPPKPPGLSWLAAGAAVVFLSLGAWYLLRGRAERPAVRPSIAVLGFRDLSGRAETSWINTAVSELINVELSGGQQLRITAPENVARMRRELSITPEATYQTQLLERIGTNLGIDYAVAGAYQPSGDSVRIDVALFDIRSGRQIAAIATETSQDRLMTVAEECAARVRSTLGIRLAPVQGPLAYPPAERAAMESYARGMERLRQSDALGARPLLETSASIAPSNPLVHSGLAAAWHLLGLDNRARDEAKQAFDTSAGLGRVEQLEIEGRYRQMDHDWPRAIKVYQALFTLSPDDLEYGLLLASVQTYGGKAQDALATVGALRNLPRPLKDDPRIDLAEAQSAGALADFARTRRAAHAASDKAAQRGARLQYARARLLESGAMQNLKVTGFADVRAEARGICAELGDRACVASAYRIEANALLGYASPAAARPLYQTVLEIANQIGNLTEKINALEGMGYCEKLQGNLTAAASNYKEAIVVASEFGPQKQYPVWIDLAEVLAEEGKIADARALGEQALDSARQSHDRESIAISQAVLAHAFALEGKFPDAIARYDEAVRILREVQNSEELATALLELGKAQLGQGNAAEARRNFEEARDMDHGNGGLARADLDLAFARLEAATHQPERAVPLARSALNAFAAVGREGDRMEAAALLARVLVAGGHAKDAAGVLAPIPSPEGKALPFEAVFQFRIARCLVDANAGRRVEAAQGMERIAAEAARLGLPPLAHETRLARAAVMKIADAPHRDLRQ